MKKKVIVKQNEQNPIPAEVIASEISAIAKAMRILSTSKLKREAIVTLIKDKSGISKATIELVMNNLESLDTTWLKKVTSTIALVLLVSCNESKSYEVSRPYIPEASSEVETMECRNTRALPENVKKKVYGYADYQNGRVSTQALVTIDPIGPTVVCKGPNAMEKCKELCKEVVK